MAQLDTPNLRYCGSRYGYNCSALENSHLRHLQQRRLLQTMLRDIRASSRRSIAPRGWTSIIT